MFSFFSNRGLVFKIITAASSLTLIFLAAFLTLSLGMMRDELLDTTLSVFESNLDAELSAVESGLSAILRDVAFFNELPATQGLIRAEKSKDGIDPEKGVSLEEWEERLEEVFFAEAHGHDFYYQLRYIDQEGYERVRVNSEKGEIVRVPKDELQYKGDRYYIEEIEATPRDETYISPIDLNREGAEQELEIPYRPVVRYGRPVFDIETGERMGAIVLNVDVYRLLEKSLLAGSAGSNVYIVNSEGYFMYHPDESKRWGSPEDLGTGVVFFDEFKNLAFEVGGSTNVFRQGSVVYTWGYLHVGGGVENNLLVVREYDFGFLATSIQAVAYEVVFLSSGFFLLLLFVFWWTVRFLLGPLEDLVVRAMSISEGDLSTTLRARSNDEIGRLVKAFNVMVKSLKSSFTELEEEVKSRTADLNTQLEKAEEQNETLKRTRRAMLSVLEDLESEKERVKGLADDLQKFRLAVENASDHIVITDSDGIILYANPAVEKITGFSEKEVLGTKAGKLWGGLMTKEFYAEMWDSIKVKKKAFSGEVINKKKDGTEYTALTSISPVVNESGEVAFFVGIERDITKEKEVDRAKTEFVSLASHQLRTPLSSINWYAEMLLDGDAGELNEDQKMYLSEIYDGNQRMVVLINALLNVSRLELGTFAVELEPVDVVALAESVIKEQKNPIEKKDIKLTTDFEEGIPSVPADPNLLRMIFQNLLSNSVKYTPEKGSISMKLCLKKEDLLFEISDTGWGIPAGDKERIFDKLFRATNVRQKDTEGTGLGLYLVKSIVEHSGGTISFESKENEGTTFYVTIPKEGMKYKEGTRSLSNV